MKATGLVRRIDDLGRVVIPKEIRRTYGINSGDPLEIFTDNEGCIILKKYDPLPEIRNRVEKLQEMITENTNYEPEVTKSAVTLLTELEKLLNDNETKQSK
jgi:AbrB family transcriptional regulator (stage V sporulation protein T)